MAFKEHLADYVDDKYIKALKSKCAAFEVEMGDAWKKDPEGQEQSIMNWIMANHVEPFKKGGVPLDFLASLGVGGLLGWVRKNFYKKEKTAP